MSEKQKVIEEFKSYLSEGEEVLYVGRTGKRSVKPPVKDVVLMLLFSLIGVGFIVISVMSDQYKMTFFGVIFALIPLAGIVPVISGTLTRHDFVVTDCRFILKDNEFFSYMVLKEIVRGELRLDKNGRGDITLHTDYDSHTESIYSCLTLCGVDNASEVCDVISSGIIKCGGKADWEMS